MATNVVTESNRNPIAGATQVGLASDTVRQILIVVAVLSTIVVNALANILPINGMNTGELSDKFVIFITPAGYVFSIWSIIYLGLLAYTIYQAQKPQRDNPRLRAIAMPFFISSFANMAWIFVWHYELVPLSWVAMIAILGSLIAIYTRLFPSFDSASAAERWMTHIPFRIYLAWITVATIVNTTVILDYYGWSGGSISPEVWTAVMLGVGTVVGLFFTLVNRDVAYGTVLVWAFVGIAAKHSGVPIVFGAAAATAVIMALSVVSAVVRNWRLQTT
ncbi:MAG: TspO/MBR family protein [Chloroflexota bacterium]